MGLIFSKAPESLRRVDRSARSHCSTGYHCTEANAAVRWNSQSWHGRIFTKDWEWDTFCGPDRHRL